MAGFWKKLGKVALKAAPYAALAIPGLGIPASMAISGGLAAANKKAEGGSWKDALLSGGIGAGAAYAGGKIPGLDKVGGIGPGASTKSKILGGIMDTVGARGELPSAGGWQGALGGVLGNIGKNAVSESIMSDDPRQGGIGGNLPSKPIGPSTNPLTQGAPVAPSATIPANQPKDFGPGVFGEYGEFGDFKTRNPDIAGALAQGRAAAIGGNRFSRRGERGRGRRPQMQPMMAQ